MTPFLKISLNTLDNDIRDRVSNFSITDSIGEDSVLQFTYTPRFNAITAIGEPISSKDTVIVQFGFLGGSKSGVLKFKVSDLKYRYGANVSITVSCADRGNVMRKSTSNVIWKNVTSFDIVREIAEKYGLGYEVEGQPNTWSSLPQANRSDFDFLTYLCKREKDGNFIVYIQNGKLFYVRRGKDKSSIFNFVYRGESDDVLAFNTKYKKITRKPENISTVFSSIFDSGEEAKENDSGGKDVNLGEIKHVFDEDGNELGQTDGSESFLESAVNFGKNLLSPQEPTNELSNQAKSNKKEGELKVLSASLRINGNPLMVANEVITMGGLYKIHNGNWLIEKVRHSITPSGFITSCELRKDGVKVGTGDTNNSVNDKKGTPKKQKEFGVFDAEGNLLSTRQGDTYKAPLE